MGKYIHPALVTIGEGPHSVSGIKPETFEAILYRIKQLYNTIEARRTLEFDITAQVLELSGLEAALMTFTN